MRPAAGPAASIALVVLALAGCGTKTASLDVRYPETGVNRALLASASPRRVQVGPVVDRRAETPRLGSKPKGQGDIVTRRPVAEIVREALVAEVGKNRHTVVSDRPDAVITAAVDAFSLDAVDGYSSSSIRRQGRHRGDRRRWPHRRDRRDTEVRGNHPARGAQARREPVAGDHGHGARPGHARHGDRPGPRRGARPRPDHGERDAGHVRRARATGDLTMPKVLTEAQVRTFERDGCLGPCAR